MYTVNAEYQKKNIELQELNNDIEHLLNGTDVATMFHDRQLCIRKFTPRIADTFRVIPQDIGRHIRTFTHDLSHPTLMADIEENSNSFRHSVELERHGVTPTLTILASPHTRITAGYEHFRDTRIADRGVPSFQGRPADVDIATFFGDPANSRVHARADTLSTGITHQTGAVTHPQSDAGRRLPAQLPELRAWRRERRQDAG